MTMILKRIHLKRSFLIYALYIIHFSALLGMYLGYVQWFLEQNTGKKHHFYFINVPAPVYDEKLTTDLNSETARTVVLFNTALKQYSLQQGFDTVDVFKFTAGKEGFSNGLFHVDGRHLGAKVIAEIEQPLS